MTKYATGNPVGSTDPRDLYDNSENLDSLINGPELSYDDRTGKARRSYAGFEKSFDQFLASSGYEFLGDYASGIEVTEYNQIIREAGEFWRAASGTSLPYTTTGTGMPEGGSFVSVGDANIRQDLASDSEGSGASLVSMEDGSTVEVAINKRVVRVGSVSEIEGLEAVGGHQVSLSGEGAGVFEFDDSDLSGQVSGDFGGIDFLAPDSDPTGASGAWVRQLQRPTEKFQFNGENADLLCRLRSQASARGMYFRTIDANKFGVGIGMSENDSSTDKYVIEYRFQKDGDDLVLLKGCFSGVGDESAIRATATLNGTFTTSTVNSYTTTVGDTFTATFTGRRMTFRTFTDDRGGIWEATLSNGRVARVSTYSSVSEGPVEILVFDNLEHREYTVQFEFLGDDPLSAPSGGTSRGWLRYGTDVSLPDEQPIKYGNVAPIDTATEQAVLSESTINDFAMSVRPEGAVYDREWVPQHSSVSGVAIGVGFSLMVDSARIGSGAGFIPSTGGAYDYLECSEVKLIHTFDAVNPNGASGTMWEHYITHDLSLESLSLKISNRMEIAQDVDIGSGYFGMMGVDSNNLSRLVLSNGVERNSIPQDDTSEDLGWGITSGMVAGEYSSGRYHGAAIRISSLREAANLNNPRLEQNLPILITYRSDGVAKLYWKFAGSDHGPNVLASGDIYKCQSELCVVSGIRSPNVLIKSV